MTLLCHREVFKMLPEQIEELRAKKQQSFIDMSGRAFERAKPYIDEVERNLFKINAGGTIATLALIGQAITKDTGIAAWLTIPAIGFTISMLSVLLIMLARFQEHTDQAVQLLHFAKNLPDDLQAEPQITSKASRYIRTFYITSGLGFCLSALSLVLIFAFHAIPFAIVWAKLVSAIG